ncbi:MAG: phenylalanine--tRNA ligase subunit alpha [Archaeoglobales archaeon]|nr:MAG: phenylalanine--tRNA ligase subunit alpha [Archaeoglobales archaeon]
MLTPFEVKILQSLEEDREYRLDEAERVAKISRDAIIKGAYLLKEKGYAEVREVVRKIYRLTEEGREYLERGLPEEELFEFLKDKGEFDLDELEKFFDKRKIGIALGWLRRRGVVEIVNGKIVVVGDAKFEERDYLRLVADGKFERIPKSSLKELRRRRLIDEEERKEIYIKILKKPSVKIKGIVTDLTPEMIISGSWRDKEFLRYDVKIPSKDIYGGKVHPYERIIRECRRIFLEMGFREIKGNYVQPAFWNFDALFQPQDHPARDLQDTFYIDEFVKISEDLVEKVKLTHEKGWITGSTGWGGSWDVRKAEQLVLRTHTTAVTIKYLAENPEPPQKAFCIDRVYRREAIDPTHLPEFDQLEGVVLDRDVGFSHLLGLLKEFFSKMGFENVRFRPGYFPYTEPSVEPEVYVEGLGWVELGGAGVFRREVTEPLGIRGKVLAWGLGIGRLAMLKLGLKDLRRLYLPDIGWLRRMPAIKKSKC